MSEPVLVTAGGDRCSGWEERGDDVEHHNREVCIPGVYAATAEKN